jgi:Zn-finger nucleic acid-binding protein
MTRRTLEARYPCPVCLGATMKKVRLVDKSGALVLDYCGRCGGMWFELGEVQRLRKHAPDALWSSIERRAEAHRMQCHDCQAVIDRNCAECPACGWKNLLRCPACDRVMQPQLHEGLRLDVCQKCRGVWFDHVELEAIWRAALEPRSASVAGRGGRAADIGASVGEVLFWSPDLLFYGAHASGVVIEGAASALSNAPQALGGAAEAVGDAAGSVFEAIVEIIGGIFS